MIGSVGGLILKFKIANNIIPSLIGQPQMAIQRMSDPDPAYHQMNILFMQFVASMGHSKIQ